MLKFRFHEGIYKTHDMSSVLSAFVRFRFHEGIYKTFLSVLSVFKCFVFRFHEGIYKTGYCRHRKSCDVSHLDSTKVYIKLYHVSSYSYSPS